MTLPSISEDDEEIDEEDDDCTVMPAITVSRNNFRTQNEEKQSDALAK